MANVQVVDRVPLIARPGRTLIDSVMANVDGSIENMDRLITVVEGLAIEVFALRERVAELERRTPTGDGA